MPVPLLHLARGEGRTFDILGGDRVTVKVTGEQTGGTFAMIDTVSPPHMGPPPHVHHREDEIFYVVEGRFEFYVAGQTIAASAGSTVLAPRGIPHRFQNVGDTPGRLVIIVQPAGFENFAEELSQFPLDQPPDPVRLKALGDKYGIEFLPA